MSNTVSSPHRQPWSLTSSCFSCVVYGPQACPQNSCSQKTSSLFTTLHYSSSFWLRWVRKQLPKQVSWQNGEGNTVLPARQGQAGGAGSEVRASCIGMQELGRERAPAHTPLHVARYKEKSSARELKQRTAEFCVWEGTYDWCTSWGAPKTVIILGERSPKDVIICCRNSYFPINV